MSKSENSILEENIRDFLASFGPVLEDLSAELNTARISHYSSGCGTKSITFDIFPASAQIDELLRMLSLNRGHKGKISSGLKDVSPKMSYNPADDFLLYLRRWTSFAEQVMCREGDSPRGISAARAKLMMDDLMVRLGKSKLNNNKPSRFAKLMEDIGLALAARNQNEDERRKANASQQHEYNYRKALAMAQNLTSIHISDHPQAA